MTQLPAEQVRIGKGIEDVDAVDHDVCCMPLCTETHKLDPHHIVRRSHLGGAYDGVEIDGEVQSNVVTLCRAHHQDITENKARIMFDGGKYWWSEAGEKDLLMRPQPALVSPPGTVIHTVAWGGPLEKMRIDANLEQCPRCKGKGRVPAKAEEKDKPVRKYRTWSMGIPVDAGENGYEIWIEHLEQATEKLRPELGYSDTVPPYYVLVAVTRDWLNS